MAKNKLTIKVDIDTKEALKQMKEVTEVANEFLAALEKLEKVMGKFTDPAETIELYCDGKLLAKSIVEQTADSIQGRIIKGEELRGVR